MGKEASTKRKELVKGRLNRDIKKRMVKALIWSVTIYGAETYNTIQYNSRLLKISKLTKAVTAITGYNIAYSDTNQLMFPHRKQSTANT